MPRTAGCGVALVGLLGYAFGAMDDPRSLFPVTRRWAYLNNAHRGPLSVPARAAVDGYLDSLMRDGVTAWAEWHEVWKQTNATFADFIGAPRGSTQFLANASDAFSRVTLGLEWRKGDHAVVPEFDYPGVARAVLDLRRRDVDVTLVRARADGLLNADDLLNAITPRTRLVAASWVDFRTGCRLDVAKLAGECRAREVFCAVDAVQAVGVIPFHVAQVGADAMTFAARKYLNGLDALGALYVRPESMHRLTPHTLGVYSVERPYDFDALEQPLADRARRFQLGAPAVPQVYALKAALELQANAGRQSIAEAVRGLADEVRRQADEHGIERLDADWPAESCSHIVALRTPDDTLPDRLKAAGVSAALRTGVLRVSPHWYNTPEDTGRLFEVLSQRRR
jgi:cysteine desulfurase / selenocysteine lyase